MVAALEAGDHERVLELLLEQVQGADGERRDELRRWMVDLFTELGKDHALSSTYRRRLAAALY